MKENPYVVGLDLGQSSDPTALAILRRSDALNEAGRPRLGGDQQPLRKFDCVHLHRYPLGTPYPSIVADVADMLARPELSVPGTERSAPPDVPMTINADGTVTDHAPTVDLPPLAVDATGVGRPVVDMFTAAKLKARLMPVTITAGAETRYDRWGPGVSRAAWVPKTELVSVVQAALQGERLKVAAGLPLADTLKKELLNFKVKVSLAGAEQFGAWREGDHDDLVLAVALAMWLGEQRRRETAGVLRGDGPRSHHGAPGRRGGPLRGQHEEPSGLGQGPLRGREPLVGQPDQLVGPPDAPLGPGRREGRPDRVGATGRDRGVGHGRCRAGERAQGQAAAPATRRPPERPRLPTRGGRHTGTCRRGDGGPPGDITTGHETRFSVP